MVELNQIPHIDEIAHHGVFHGAAEKKPATFQERSASQNKIVPSLEEAIRRTGLRDGMTISFHHHFRNGDHIINQVVALLTKMGFRNLTLAPSSLSAVHAPLIEAIRSGVITHIETSGMRGELAEQVSRGLIDCPVVFRSHGGRASAIRSGELHEPYAVLLTSDGGGDTLFDRQQQQPAHAVERLCDWLTENDEKTVTEALAHVIKEKMIPATEDDVSVAILYCGEEE